MFCVKCGGQIADSSRFCAHCGQKLTTLGSATKQQNTEKTIETEITRQVFKKKKNILDVKIFREVLGWYLLWVLLQLGLLLIFSYDVFGRTPETESFWPFGQLSIKAYDITEFLFYTFVPIGLLFVLMLLYNPKKESGNKSE